MRSEFEPARLLTLLDMAAVSAVPGAALGADVSPIEEELKQGAALGADVDPKAPRSPQLAADGPVEPPSLGADMGTGSDMGS